MPQVVICRRQALWHSLCSGAWWRSGAEGRDGNDEDQGRGPGRRPAREGVGMLDPLRARHPVVRGERRLAHPRATHDMEVGGAAQDRGEFDAETVSSATHQRKGWQTILDSFWSRSMKKGYRSGSLRYPSGSNRYGRLRYLKIESKKVNIDAQAMLASSS